MVSAVLVSAALAQAPSKRTPPDLYQRWIDEDVVYITTPLEQAQYLQLTTNKDRDQFIIAFWQRRNPVPGSAENTFKEEHYRRLAYTNIHFADSRPGWRTDRGRVYIVNGQPQEIKFVSAQDSPSRHRTEIWQYKSGQEFRFVDECDCGQYEIRSSWLEYLWNKDLAASYGAPYSGEF
jgi:GWxTD domain-containing protein